MRRGITGLVQVPLLVLASSLVASCPLSAQHAGATGSCHQDTSVGQSTLDLPHVFRTLPKYCADPCTRHPHKVVNRDIGRVGSRPHPIGGNRDGRKGSATLPFTLVTPGWRTVMAFRWDTACLMPVMQTIPRDPHRCHSNRLMKLPIDYGTEPPGPEGAPSGGPSFRPPYQGPYRGAIPGCPGASPADDSFDFQGWPPTREGA